MDWTWLEETRVPGPKITLHPAAISRHTVEEKINMSMHQMTPLFIMILDGFLIENTKSRLITRTLNRCILSRQKIITVLIYIINRLIYRLLN